jgi:hypothetical protein
MRTFAGLFVGGVAALLLFKLVAGLIFPLIALVVGLLGMAFKIAIFVAIGYFVYSLVRGRKREQTVT